jgi:hypothetical protein
VQRAWQRDWSYQTRTARPAPGVDYPSRSTFAGVR